MQHDQPDMPHSMTRTPARRPGSERSRVPHSRRWEASDPRSTAITILSSSESASLSSSQTVLRPAALVGAIVRVPPQGSKNS